VAQDRIWTQTESQYTDATKRGSRSRRTNWLTDLSVASNSGWLRLEDSSRGSSKEDSREDSTWHQSCNCLTVAKICSGSYRRAQGQDRWTDWMTVSCKVTLTGQDPELAPCEHYNAPLGSKKAGNCLISWAIFNIQERPCTVYLVTGWLVDWLVK